MYDPTSNLIRTLRFPITIAVHVLRDKIIVRFCFMFDNLIFITLDEFSNRLVVIFELLALNLGGL